MLTILVLSVLVLLHELGHFLIAKLFGIHVLEFGIGLPPKALKIFKYKETEYTLNWLPIGGFVRSPVRNLTLWERINPLTHSHMFLQTCLAAGTRDPGRGDHELYHRHPHV